MSSPTPAQQVAHTGQAGVQPRRAPVRPEQAAGSSSRAAPATDQVVPPADLPASAAGPRRWRALAVSLVAAFMALLDSSIVNVALPSMERGLGASAGTIQWVVSGYALAFGLAPVPAGRLLLGCGEGAWGYSSNGIDLRDECNISGAGIGIDAAVLALHRRNYLIRRAPPFVPLVELLSGPRAGGSMAIETAEFGRTGHVSARVIFGGAALAATSQRVADETLELLLRYGVNHIDVASSYGEAEVRIRPWLREPDRFFVATKGDERTAAGARVELHRSLDRLGVDHVDLWQLHALADPIEWDVALSPGGAIEAAVEAREQGLVRWIGVTGHGAQIAATHRRSLDRFDFDSVLLPYNFVTMQNSYYAANFEAVYRTCQERRVAMQTIKSIALRPWKGRPHTRSTWYEPLERQKDIDLAVWWALSRPGIFLDSVGDVELLPKVLDAASRFTEAPDDAAMSTLLHRSRTEPLFV